MAIGVQTKFIYRSSNFDQKYFEKILQKPLPFDNTEYELRISGTVETDRRIMSFVNTFWGLEVTGGYDQFEPLIVVDVKKSGYAYRAGIRKGDIITRINKVYTDDMTLQEAQLLIKLSGRREVKFFVRGDAGIDDGELEWTVDFWFKPRKKFPPIHIENKWSGEFPWNDKRKKIYRESNCFMVPSRAEERKHEKEFEEEMHRQRLAEITPSDENTTSSYERTNGHSEQNGNAEHILSNGLTNGASNGEHKEEQNEQNNHDSNQ